MPDVDNEQSGELETLRSDYGQVCGALAHERALAVDRDARLRNATTEIDRLRTENEHLAGALERATVGQLDPVSLRLGHRPVDTGPQPPPDLQQMRRLMDTRRETGCVAASVWLHDLQWILDRLAQLSADAHRVRQQRQTALERAELWQNAAADCAEDRRRLLEELGRG